nr:uncharacterized protein LOC109149045 [Ipomoea batatas]
MLGMIVSGTTLAPSRKLLLKRPKLISLHGRIINLLAISSPWINNPSPPNGKSLLQSANLPGSRIYSMKEAEAIEVIESLSWIKDQCFSHCEVETDALQVVQSLTTSKLDSQFDLILLDINNILSFLSDVVISFVKRSTNQITYLLARKSLTIFPSFIVNINEISLH